MHNPPQRRTPAADTAALAALILIFLWVYGRFAFGLYFVMDDFIHSAGEMTGPLWPTLRDTFAGALSWSGYRPLTTAFRVLLTHAFGMERMWGYYIIYLGLHLVNTLLTWRIVRRVAQSARWGFIAAAVLLLLPAHNEAVFWFAAASNVLALFFCLLALNFALAAFEGKGYAAALGVVTACGAAILAYEVTLPLPLLILLADWIRNGRDVRKRLRLYLLLAITAAALMLLRLLVQGGSLVPVRGDYAANFAVGHIVRGYKLIFSQILLLYTSPYPGAPLYAWGRNWLNPAGPLALLTIGATLLLTIVTFAAAQRAERASLAKKQAASFDKSWLWLLWGILWMLVMGFAFASLTGRNPENRYTYLLTFGFAVAITALVAALYHRLHKVRVLQFALLGVVAGLISFYAYVSLGDARDWTAAGAIVRTVQESIQSAIPTLDADQAISQIGIPSHVGSAYTYSIERAFQDAMFLLYGQGQPGFADNETLRAWFSADPERAHDTYAFSWDAETQSIVPIVAVILCQTYDDCRYFELRRPDGASKNRGLRYVQIYDTDNPQLGGVALLATLQPYAVRSCYIFQDYNVYTDPNAFWDYPQDQRCADAITAFWDFSE